MSLLSLKRHQMLAVLLACVVPPLMAYNMVSTSPTLNYLAAFAAWGGVLFTMGHQSVQWRLGSAAWMLLLLLTSVWLSWYFAGLTLDLVLSNSGVLLATLLLLLVGQGLNSSTSRQAWFEALCWGLLIAGLLCVVVSIIQVFLPAWADDVLVARSVPPTRAIGNLRQPNHLAAQLVLACVSSIFLFEKNRLSIFSGKSNSGLLAILFGLVFAVVLSASRAGMAMVIALAFWGFWDRSLGKAARRALFCAPVMLLVSWGLISQFAAMGWCQFGAATRLAEQGIESSERLKHLIGAWELLKQYPVTGVGWSEFNFANTMAVLPHRSHEFVDHAHNLVAQLLVELGWPTGLLVLALLAISLCRVIRISNVEGQEMAQLRRNSLMLVVTMLLFGMLEYQLWYNYFLFPIAFAFGVSLWEQKTSGLESTTPQNLEKNATRPLPMAGLLMVCLSLAVFFDYTRVVSITLQPPNGMSLEQRILQAQQRSLFFSAQADYAAATFFPPGQEALDAARRTAHSVSDDQVLISWANSLAVTGDVDRARHIAQRLQEFKTPAANEWLSHCRELSPSSSSRPFQCEPPKRAYSYQEMR